MNELRAAYVDLCRGIDVQYSVTLASNQDGTIAGIRKRARDFCARMDRKLLGPSWSKKPAEQRTDGVFFIEHVASNIHLHGLLRFPSSAASINWLTSFREKEGRGFGLAFGMRITGMSALRTSPFAAANRNTLLSTAQLLRIVFAAGTVRLTFWK